MKKGLTILDELIAAERFKQFCLSIVKLILILLVAGCCIKYLIS